MFYTVYFILFYTHTHTHIHSHACLLMQKSNTFCSFERFILELEMGKKEGEKEKALSSGSHLNG